MAKLKTTEQDFDLIKANLKDYLRNQTVYTDYDFDGSALSHLLDVMAYNTHYSALTANMSVNEMFLDSSVVRNNIVSHSKGLGYTPISMRSATAEVTVTGSTAATTVQTIPRGSVFSSASSKFVTLTDYTANPVGGSVTWTGVKLYEGKLIKNTFTVGTEEQVYEIPNASCDTTTIRVRIKDTLASTTYTEYTLAKYLTDVKSDSLVYFLQEGRDQKFDVSFGDNILGKKLTVLNIIEIEYVRCNGIDGNAIKVFTMDAVISGLTNKVLTTTTNSAGGAAIESVDSIKLNAPFNYASQNRAVTADDYNTLIKQIYPSIDAISVWGGEDNDPPIYGKVYSSIKPTTGTVLTSAAKASIIKSLKSYKVMSIIPEIVDPEYLYLVLDVVFKYNSGVTFKTSSELEALVQGTIDTYNTGELLSFNKMFRYSNLSTLIDATDDSIVSSTTRISVKKYTTPVLNTATQYQVDFFNPLYNPESGHMPLGVGILVSNGFYKTGNTETIYYIQDDGAGALQLYHKTTGTTTLTLDDTAFGTVDYTTGRVIITSLSIASFTGTDDSLALTVAFDSSDVVPVRNQIIQIESSVISGEEDTIASGTYSGSTNYVTTPARA